MTTLAFDGKILASDSRLSSEHTIIDEHCRKIYYYPEHRIAVAMAGQCPSEKMLTDWACAEVLQGQPMVLPDECNNFQVLVAKYDEEDDKVKIFTGYCGASEKTGGDVVGHCEQLYTVPQQGGSGGDVALGAMLAGCDAIAAIEAAKKRDLFTGGETQWINMETGEHTDHIPEFELDPIYLEPMDEDIAGE